MELQAALDGFMRSRKAIACSEKTLATYARECRIYARYFDEEGIQDTAQIVPEQLQSFLAAAYDRGISSHTLKSYRLRLGAFINWCAEMGYCPEGMMQKVRRVQASRFFRKTYTEDEFKALLEFARLRPFPYWAKFDVAVLMLLMDTGMRVGELCGLKIGDMSPDGKIKLRGKGHRDRYVTASPATLNAVAEYLKLRGTLRPTEPLFLNKDGMPVTDHGIYQRLRRLGRRIGIAVNPHKFRHTFAQMALQNGANIKDLQMFLGHSQLQTTDNYLQGFGNDQALRDHENFSPVRGMFQH